MKTLRKDEFFHFFLSIIAADHKKVFVSANTGKIFFYIRPVFFGNGLKASCHLDQNIVANIKTKSIVYMFKIIQVNGNSGKLLILRIAAR